MLVQPSILKQELHDGFFSQTTREFYAYWQSLVARRGSVPFRDDLDPAEIPRLLPQLFIVERVPVTGRYLFRLSGTGIRDIMGVENTNHFLDELLNGDDLRAVSQMFDDVLGQGACIRSIEGLTYCDRSFLRVEILRLPLRANDGERRLIMGCLSRIENDPLANAVTGTVKDKQVIRIENDVLPRRSL